MEQWKPVKGYEGFYSVSSEGRVRRDAPGKGAHTGAILSELKHPQGYRFVKLSTGNVNKAHLIHRLVAGAFCKKAEGKNVVNHYDGDKANNGADNLSWVTVQENNQHNVRVLEQSRKLSDDDVLEIRRKYAVDRMLQRDIAKAHGISQNQVSLVIIGKAWTHLPNVVRKRLEPDKIVQKGPEEWKTIPSYPKYEVSNRGRVRPKVPQCRKAHDDGKGYLQLRLCDENGVTRTVKAHRLVAEAFLGPAEGRQVNHRNGKRADNRLANLEYVDGQKENMRHAYGYEYK